MKILKISVIVTAFVGATLWMISTVIESPFIDEVANPWFQIIAYIAFAIGMVLAIIYALKAQEHQGKKGNWFYWVSFLIPAYFFVRACIDIYHL